MNYKQIEDVDLITRLMAVIIKFLVGKSDFSAWDITKQARIDNPGINMPHDPTRDLVHSIMNGGAFGGHDSPLRKHYRQETKQAADGRDFIMYVYDYDWQAVNAMLNELVSEFYDYITNNDKLSFELDEFNVWIIANHPTTTIAHTIRAKDLVAQASARYGFDYDSGVDKYIFIEDEDEDDDEDMDDDYVTLDYLINNGVAQPKAKIASPDYGVQGQPRALDAAELAAIGAALAQVVINNRG